MQLFIKKYNKLIITILSILILFLIISFIVVKVKNNRLLKNDPAYSSSFFLKDKNDYYALYNNKGSKISENIYASTNNFYNGVAKVKNTEAKLGVVNEKGKYIIKFDKYETIYQYGGLFKVGKENEKKADLVDSNGKKIIKNKEFTVQTFTGIDSSVMVKLDKNYIVYNYNGDKIYTFKYNKKSANPVISAIDEYTSIYYDGLTIVYHTKTGKIISKIKDKTNYCLTTINDDSSIMLLNNCVSWDAEKDIDYKVIINNKVKDINEKCDKVVLDNNNLICTNNYIKYLLNKKLKNTDLNVGNIAYKDENNYAIKRDNDVEIIRNGKVIKTLKQTILSNRGYTKDGIYLVVKDNKYTYYNEKGKVLFKNSYQKALGFDENGLAKVSEDGQNYYYINSKGKKVSTEFSSASNVDDYYLFNKDNLTGLLDKFGRILIDNKYSKIEIREVDNIKYAYCINTDNSYELINIEKKESILTSKDIMLLNNGYISINTSDSIKYYTYQGKEIEVS